MSNKYLKQVSVLLSTALFATSCLFSSVTADASVLSSNIISERQTAVSVQKTAYKPNTSADFSLSTQNSSWGNQFSSGMDLNNLTGSQVSDWTLTLEDVSFTIDSIWCATYEKSGSSYIIKPLSWNADIAADGKASFGFNATGNAPDSYQFTVKYKKDGIWYTYDSEHAASSTEGTGSSPVNSNVPSSSASASEAISPVPSKSSEPAVSIAPNITPSVSPSTEPVTTPPVQSSLIESPMKQIVHSMPSIGNVKALIIMVQFQDVKFTNGLTANEVQKSVFGAEDKSSFRYPYESTSAFYKRASYGNLNLSGDVVTYTAKYSRSYYNNKNEYETLVMEAMNALDSGINYAEYDGDKDGYLDCFSINIPTNGTSDDDFWYGCTSTWYRNSRFRLDGTKVRDYVMNDAQPQYNHMDYYNQELCHEFGHLMGLPDYYKYYSSDYEGMHGRAGYEMMDDMGGGLSSFSKLMLGWLKTDQVKVYDPAKTSQTFTLTSECLSGNCIILPIGDLNQNYFSEYFLIEYVSNDNNYYKWAGNGGIRILHVNANVIKSIYESGKYDFKYENYSSYYNQNDQMQRILKLVNDNRGFYTAGASITYGTSNFAGYDANGSQSINTGYSIKIGKLVNGTYTLTVTKQ